MGAQGVQDGQRVFLAGGEKELEFGDVGGQVVGFAKPEVLAV